MSMLEKVEKVVCIEPQQNPFKTDFLHKVMTEEVV